jgi:Leucine-rich repeat (LRR) protein
MPNLWYLSCGDNELTSLPPMPNLVELYCRDNQLTSLPPMPKLEELYCENNPLPFFTLPEWEQYWKENNLIQ